METQELKQHPTFDYAASGLSWKPDMIRFKSEVEAARRSGQGDPLTLAEMECSLDLIDADIAALRASPGQDDLRDQVAEAVHLRAELRGLIGLLKPLVKE